MDNPVLRSVARTEHGGYSHLPVRYAVAAAATAAAAAAATATVAGDDDTLMQTGFWETSMLS